MTLAVWMREGDVKAQYFCYAEAGERKEGSGTRKKYT